MTRSRRLAWFLALAVAVLAVAATAVTLLSRDGSGRRAVSDTVAVVPNGQVRLRAEVLTPSSSGEHALVVMPTSWAQTSREYHGLAAILAKDGYVVVTYAQRGAGGSTGSVDFAGKPTQADASAVINWALAHEPVDRRRIGMFGTSYGAGVSLLAAARDARIKAVVATSGWTDFAASFDPDRTLSTSALDTLVPKPGNSMRADTQLDILDRQIATDPLQAAATVERMSLDRSPQHVLTAINANRPAIMMANGLQDSFFPPQQLIHFFKGLTGPKRLQLGVGDHVRPEGPGLVGYPNAVTDAARLWLDHFLKGVDNGIEKQAPIQVTDTASHATHGLQAWPTSSASVRLAKPDSAQGLTKDSAPWCVQLDAGVDSVATSGPPQYATPTAYRPPTIELSKVDTRHAASWLGLPVYTDTTVVGTPHLTIDAASSSGSGSLFVYVYDAAPSGSASLVSATPYTFGGEPGRLSFDLQPFAWTFASGHRLVLVIDTVDPRWHTSSPAGSTIKLSSDAASPASLALPLPLPL